MVGGAVRDEIRDIDPKDFDFCIVGIKESVAKIIVSTVFDEPCVDVISNAPVFNCGGFEFAMARKEVQTARGKSTFEFESTPEITIEEDLRRRDFTAGAIAKNVLTGEIIDPFNGRRDIEKGILRAVDPSTFVQSPERVLRGIAQSARFGWGIHPDTILLFQEMKKDFDTIPVEQIWLHFEKASQSMGKNSWWFAWNLGVTGWSRFFPEIRLWDSFKAFNRNSGKTEDKQIWFFVSLTENMSFNERETFFDRINAPNRIRRLTGEFHEFGGRRPARLVEGRDLMHLVEPSPKMGQMVNWCFAKQIECPECTKEELVAMVEENFK